MRIAFDMSSVLKTCLSVGVDPEGSKEEDEAGKLIQCNTAGYGYEAVINSMKSSMQTHNLTPIDAILVFEGMNSKARRLFIDRTYKGNKVKKPQKFYDEFAKLKDMVLTAFKSLGAVILSQDGVEGDDVLAWLAVNSRDDLVIRTNDNDMGVLSGRNSHGAKIICHIGAEIDTNKYGLFDTKYISLYKAMVGDSGDGIKGIVGFGETAWKNFHKRFGEAGMAELCRLADLGTLQELEEEAEQDKIVKQIWDGRNDFLRSWKLAKLHPEWVDTMQESLQWTPGMVYGTTKDERLQEWAATKRLIAGSRFDQFLERLIPQLGLRSWVALDIETSTPEESDDWLTAQGDPDGIDVIGSELTGLSITFGRNMQHTVYLPVDHVDTDNCTKDQIFRLLQALHAAGVELVIQNTSFEGTVLYNEFGDRWKDNGYKGFLPNWRDTKLEASYVDENFALGLKKLSKRWLGYDQTDYITTCTVEGPVGTLSGGRFINTYQKVLHEAVTYVDPVTNITSISQQAVTAPYERRLHKMNELTAKHVFEYATDDTVTTAALHNFFKLFMELEGTYSVYEHVELKASYQHCQSFTHGTKISVQKVRELEAEDDLVSAEAWLTVRDYLIKMGWEGTQTPVYSGKLEPKDMKEAYQIVTKQELKTAFRTPQKIIDLFKQEQPLLADVMERAVAGDFATLNQLVALHFDGEPEFNLGSPKQKVNLFYNVMGLPVRVRNKLTDTAKADGATEGAPKTDNLAVTYALLDATEEQAAVLQALRLMQMVSTRKSLYYSTYPYFVHWKTGRIHSSHNQCGTNTRRASSSKPNMQQVSKNEKVEGYSPRVREVYIPHKKDAVIVSMDFKAQELRVIADYSRDENMLSCFIGDHKKDMHAMTGLGIFKRKYGGDWDYDQYFAVLNDKSHEQFGPVKKTRGLGKTTNFTTEFGAAAPKLAQVLMVPEEEAQDYIDAKLDAFPGVVVWKDTVIEEAKRYGKVRTKLGAVRHLRELLQSQDRYTSSKAERQAVNFKVQSSSAEMTKGAECAIWSADLESRFDCEIIGAIHDEVIASVAICDLLEFIPAMHACMVQPYADMFVPIESSISLGKSFGPAHQIEIGDKPDAAAIIAGLNEAGIPHNFVLEVA